MGIRGPVPDGYMAIFRDVAALIDHLNDYPHTTEWLTELRDYLDARLAAREEAERTGGVVIPRAPGRWEIAHTNAYATVKVQG